METVGQAPTLRSLGREKSGSGNVQPENGAKFSQTGGHDHRRRPHRLSESGRLPQCVSAALGNTVPLISHIPWMQPHSTTVGRFLYSWSSPRIANGVIPGGPSPIFAHRDAARQVIDRPQMHQGKKLRGLIFEEAVNHRCGIEKTESRVSEIPFQCSVRTVDRCRVQEAETASASFGLFAYFFWKRSTRPAESTSFCLPVKKGWQAEQISTFRSPSVDRVSNALPQMQVMVERLYCG